MNRFTKSLVLATAVAGLAASGASAHGIWFAQRAKHLAFIYGEGADDLDSLKRLPLVNSVAGYDAELKPVPTKLQAHGPMVFVDSERAPAVVTAAMPYGVWTKQPDGEWVQKNKDDVPHALGSSKNYKYAVYIGGPLSKPLPAFPDQVLQIVPVAAKLPATMGQPLKLKVLFQGKPVAGVSVLPDMVNDPDAKPLMSGPDGVVVIKVRNQGLNVVSAVFHGPSDEPAKAAQNGYEATLSFVLPHAPE